VISLKNFINTTLSSRLYFITAIFLYRLLIDISYIYIVSPFYSYTGMILNIDAFKMFETYFLLFFFSFILEHCIKKPSSFFILFLFLLLVVPLTSIYSLQNQSREYLYMVLTSFLVIILSSKARAIKIKTLKNGRMVAINLSIFIGFMLFSWIIYRGGLSFINFNLFKVYDFRREARELIFPGRMSYLMTFFGKVINPTLIAYSLWKKNKSMILITIFIQVLFFSITAHKAVLFYPMLILFVYYFRNKKYIGQMLPSGLAVVALFSSIYYWVTGELALVTLFVRRVLFVTALNHYRYFETFKEMGYLYFSGKAWFPKIIEYPFELPVPNLISMIYAGHPNAWINTGFLATGYMHFGMTGMLIYSIIVGLIFRYIDYFAKHFLPMWLCIAVMITPTFSLISADLPTALMTHGIGLAIIMLWLISAKSSKIEVKLFKKSE